MILAYMVCMHVLIHVLHEQHRHQAASPIREWDVSVEPGKRLHVRFVAEVSQEDHVVICM